MKIDATKITQNILKEEPSNNFFQYLETLMEAILSRYFELNIQLKKSIIDRTKSATR